MTQGSRTAADVPPLHSLDQLPIAVDPAAIDSAMQPFLFAAGEARWRMALGKRVRKALLRSLGRLSGGIINTGGRTRSLIEKEYHKAWSAGYDRYRLDRNDLKQIPWTWRGRHLLLDPAVAGRIRALFFAAVLEELRPASVLEVGCGNGINLLSLAGAFPDTKFTGIDLTAEGVGQARKARHDAGILDLLERYTPLAIRDRSAIQGIEFLKGDAGDLPFEDGSFDLVMTVLAVEQMEGIRRRALREIARVSRGHVLMLEPFRDANASLLRRFYVYSRDYFRGSIGELEAFGLDPVWATSDFPQEAFLGTALVLCQKRTSSTA